MLRTGFPKYRWRDIFSMLLIALAYALLEMLVLGYFSADGNITLVWFSSGLALAALLIKGLHLWPGVFAGAFAIGLSVGDGFGLSFLIALGNTLEPVAAVWLLNRYTTFSAQLNQPSDFGRLTLMGMICAAISTALGPTALWLHGALPGAALAGVALHWWMADVFGIVVVAPAVLISWYWPGGWFPKNRPLETLTFSSLTVLVALVVFLDVFRDQLDDLPQGYWMFALMFWGAMRFGRHGVQWVAGVTVVTALLGAATGKGCFAHDYENSGLLNYWLFQTLFTWIGMVLALTLHDVRRANARLQAIIGASPVAYLLNDRQQNIRLLNPTFIHSFGYTRTDIPRLEDWWAQAFPDPEYRRWVETCWEHNRQKALQSGLPSQTLDVEMLCKNGEIKRVQMGTSSLSGDFAEDQLLTLLDLTEQFRANQALSNAHLLLQSILETLPIRVFWKDRQSLYLGGNRLFAEDAGLDSVADLVGKNDYQLAWTQQEAAQYQQDDQQVMITGLGRLNYEEQQTTAKGEATWRRTSKLPLRNNEQQIIGVLGMYEDITTRKRLDEQLSMRTTFLEALLDSSQDGILVVGKDGKKLLQNRRVAELWKIPAEIADQADDAVQLAFVKSRLADPEQFMAKVLELYGNTELTSHDEIELNDGVILDRYSSPIRDRQGHYYGRIWYFTDVTQMRLTQKALQQKEFHQRALLDNFPFVVWLKDTECRYLAVNQVFADKRATPIEDVIGKNDFDLFPADLAEIYRHDDRQVMASGQQKHIEEKVDRTGERIWLEVYKAPLLDEQQQVQGTVGFARDISQRKKAEEAMTLAALVFDNSSEAMLVTNADNLILNVNAAFVSMTGYSKEEVLGKDPKILNSGQQTRDFYQAMWQSINETGSWQGEIKNRRKNGEVYIQETVINTIFDPGGKPQRRVALFSDITQRKQTEEQVWQQANFDPLTGLPNRSLLQERLSLEIKKAHRTQQRFAVLFIDLDRFKEVNDAMGHEMGDELLLQVSQRLLGCVRESDTVARLGGDEFTILLADQDAIESPERVVKQLVEQLSMPFTLNSEQVYISASVGITLYPDDGQSLGQLLKNADQAMYAAKNNGRNCYSFFTPAMQAAISARAALLNDLRGALAKQEFTLAYQPIVDLVSGRIHKAEALLRWRHPERGWVSPAEFVPLAEESGLINDIGDWVFYVAMQQVKQWRQTLHPEFQISINKSPVQFLDARHQPLDWIERLRSADLPGQAIVVEITEGLLLEAGEKTAEHLLLFRDAGIQVAIDDFGTGYSALSYLKKFDIDYLKIDQSFVRNLNPGSSDFVLCEAIIVMAHKLGLKVIAEGVETERQRDLLASVACDFGQGYWFAKPMPAEQFTVQYAPEKNAD